MDKNAIKKFAVWARTELIARVSLKSVEYGITEGNIEEANVDSVGGKVLTADEKKQRQALIAEINDKGYKQVMEEVAYTWFNRFSALRFMEVNGYLPSHVRVFTDEENNFKPQIIAEAIHLDLDGLDMEKVYELKDAEKTEELYKYLLIVQCNALNKILPGMFQKIADYTELLLPDNLLREGSVIQQMIELIPEDDWKDAVQIIGWLYQYYNSEKKDDVFAALKKNVKITKENIPAATQLFTPDWIVRYMVENSLGRLWLEGHPDVKSQLLPTEEAFEQWQAECDERFNQLKANEEELNRIFIDIYGLQEELTPEVEDKDITVRKADLGREIRSFISYAVGCMFGRYSLDVDGLAYAGGEWDASKYASFAADKDNIIPICDDEYFEDDIVGLFVKFVKTVYGADTLDENLKFIADALGGKGQPKDVIRNYFLSDFYSDHCKIYQKRPIYWLFDSGKKNGFKALIYMHRYQPDTIARIRTDYVHEQQARYRTAIADLEQRIANASTGERVKLNKKLTTLQAQDTEIRTYEEKIHHLADQMISIDLDDGVKKNYAIFQDVLAKIK